MATGSLSTQCGRANPQTGEACPEPTEAMMVMVPRSEATQDKVLSRIKVRCLRCGRSWTE